MTVWEHLVANSTLAEGDGDAWDHLTNPSGEGGGGDTIINSELVKVKTLSPVKVEVEDDVVKLKQLPVTLVGVKDDIIRIKEIAREVIE